MLEVVAAEFCRSQLALAARSAGFRSAKIKEFHFAFDITLCQLIKSKGCSFWSIFSADVSPQKFVTRALHLTMAMPGFFLYSCRGKGLGRLALPRGPLSARWLCPILLTFETDVARSRLYRSQSLKVNTHFAAFFKIYKIIGIPFLIFVVLSNLLHRFHNLHRNFVNFR